MSDKAQLIAQIRFALERLSERNAEHEWEHLCRHLARETICSNILPATGPVQAGGDQGRDFETFRTFLERSPLRARSFIGLVSDKPLAFACTLEKEKGLVSKVHGDVTTIMSSGTPITGIYAFCSCGIAVSKRHKLKEWALTTHNIGLELLDGAAIAELLCNRDLFWIAQRYLELDTEILPALPTGQEKKDWYTTTLEKWRRETRPPQTFAHFSEIQAAARTALGPFTYSDDGAPISRHELPELPFWIERLDEITTMNYRLDRIRRTLSPEADMAASLHVPYDAEPEDALPVPLEEYEEENLRRQFQMFLIAFAKTYKLELHQPTPVFSAIEDFLAKRYNFWTDDVEHDDPFAL